MCDYRNSTSTSTSTFNLASKGHETSNQLFLKLDMYDVSDKCP